LVAILIEKWLVSIEGIFNRTLAESSRPYHAAYGIGE